MQQLRTGVDYKVGLYYSITVKTLGGFMIHLNNGKNKHKEVK